MNVWYKPRLQSVDNIIKTQVLGGEVSPKQIDAVQEEALDVVLAALNGEAGMSGPDIPFLCAALHFWRDELIERMRREHPRADPAGAHIPVHHQGAGRQPAAGRDDAAGPRTGGHGRR